MYVCMHMHLMYVVCVNMHVCMCINARITVSFSAEAEVNKARSPKGFYYLRTCMYVCMYACMYVSMYFTITMIIEVFQCACIHMNGLHET